MTRLLILGATGSIGTTCLNALRKGLAPDISIAGLTASSSPALLSLADEFSAPAEYIDGSDADKMDEFIRKASPDIILNAIAGSAGLQATLAAIGCGCDIALANKESVVMGGRFMLGRAEEKGVRIIPVDSEHSAIYHLLRGRKARRLIITASGGPFIDREDISSVTVEEALRHPTWKMGRKITIDSATLANKGLEVMEASLLFGFQPDDISVTIHRQSEVHSMIETDEGAVYALISPPDMTLPILTAVQGEGTGLRDIVGTLPFAKGFSLTFEPWKEERFPMLALAYEALRAGGGARIAYCRADECAVNAFLRGRIPFSGIAGIVREVMSQGFTGKEPSSYEEIMEIDSIARERAEALC